MKHRWMQFFGILVTAILLFHGPLVELLRLCLTNELYSYILLIPGISGYLIWLRRKDFSAPDRSVVWTLCFGLGGAIVSAGGALLDGHDEPASIRLSVQIIGFVLVVLSGGFWCFGTRIMGAIAFPVCFLLFFVPIPDVGVRLIETFLQHASAEAAAALFALSGTPVVRTGLVFWLPGLHIEVARECSGIRSTLVLLVTACVAGNLMLRAPGRQVLLPLVVFPLGIARNALRIYILSMLSVHVDPSIIDSALHHRGGPLFFAISLLPLFLLVWVLRRSERSPVAQTSRKAISNPR